jgi:hypothetical protein
MSELNTTSEELIAVRWARRLRFFDHVRYQPAPAGTYNRALLVPKGEAG